MRSIVPETAKSPSCRPSFSPGGDVGAAEPHLEPPRHEREIEVGLDPQERLQVALQPTGQLRPPTVSPTRWPPKASCRQRSMSGQAASTVVGCEPIDADLGGQLREEPRQRGVGDRAAQLGVQLEVDLAGAQHPLHEPDGRAVTEPLELGDREPLGARQIRRAAPGRASAVERR